MKKKYITFLITIVFFFSLFHIHFNVYANEYESQATVNLIREDPPKSQIYEEKDVSKDPTTESIIENIKIKEEKNFLPKTNDFNSPLLSIIGALILLTTILGMFVIKRKLSE